MSGNEGPSTVSREGYDLLEDAVVVLVEASSLHAMQTDLVCERQVSEGKFNLLR